MSIWIHANYIDNLLFRKIVDIEETQTLETTEIIEEQPTEVNENIKYNKNYTLFKKKNFSFQLILFFFHNFSSSY